MGLGGLSGNFFKMSEWISRLAYANILWVFFTLVGLIFFGFMPATVALFTVVRKWVKGENDVPVFSLFYKMYRKEFLKSNKLGLILFLFGYILYIDLAFIPAEGMFYTLVRMGVLVISFLYIIVLLYIFPVYVHYDWKISLYLKYAFILGVSYPILTLGMLVGLGILYTILTIVPGIIPFFSVSLLAFLLMKIAMLVFSKVESLAVNKPTVEKG